MTALDERAATFYPRDVDGFDPVAWLHHRCAHLYGPDADVDLVLRTPELRRDLTVDDPVLFAWVYLSRHITDRDGRISFAGPHLEWAEQARRWMAPAERPGEDRDGYIAPRELGKTTWWFLIIPMWALAHDHVRFIASFADSATQAEQHLTTFRRELDTNQLLALDFPALCAPARRTSGGGTVADRQGMLHTSSGATFAARGADQAVLGMKVEDRRPDVLICDDLEPAEAKYSPELAAKRLGTLVNAILPLNVFARVVLVGTTTMPGSITHQLVKHAAGVETADWIREERWRAHHHRPFRVLDDGREVSVWPQKWPTAWLQQRRATREFALNYDNDPLARDGVYWTRSDFRYDHDGAVLASCTRTLIEVDPAVTTTGKSDFTGLVVASFSPSTGKVVVRHAVGVRLTGGPLRDHVAKLLAEFPAVRVIRVEVNQGGDLWKDVFAGLPDVRVLVHTVSASKEVRLAGALEHYQRGRVLHTQQLAALEEQQVGFPHTQHDDIADAAASAVNYFLAPVRAAGSGSKVGTWI